MKKREGDGKSDRITFSIIVAVYNVEQFLTECIDSILAQTYENYELILVNDGSKDRSRHICESYCRRSSHVLFINKEQNEGLVCARKTGLSAASGEYVCYVDGDDRVTNDWLEKISSLLLNAPRPDIIAYGYERFCRNHNEKTVNYFAAGIYEPHDPSFCSEVLYCGTKPFFSFGLYPSLCTKVFSKKILEKWQFPVPDDIKMGEDLAVSLPAILDSCRILVLDEFFYQYRVNGDSITRCHSDDEFRQLHVLAEYLQQVLKEGVCVHQRDLENQLYCYVLSRIEQIFFATAKTKLWGEMKLFLNSELTNELHTMASKALIRNASVKKQLTICLLKRKQYHVLYSLIRLKNVHRAIEKKRKTRRGIG